MATIPETVINTISKYLSKISLEIPVKKAILFGSYAKGTYDEESDIDLAIFSDHFESMLRVEGTTYLLVKAQEFEEDIEAVAFTGKEYDDRLGIVDEILTTGIDVQEII